MRNGKKTEKWQKRPKNSKKSLKIALLILHLLYLYHVWKIQIRGHGAPLPPPLPAADAHVFVSSKTILI